MIPTNSSASTNGCDNISSNCVIWQGPDISCIDLCNGDTISDVTAKLATKVCDIITNGVSANPSLAGLDLTCLNIPGQTPTTLVPVLQAMVNQICQNSGRSSNQFTGSLQSTSTTVQNNLPIMTLPSCLVYDDANGNPVTQLPLDEFATLIAQQVCSNLQSIQLINTTLTSHDTRISTLEACVLPCSGVVAEKQVIPTCVVNVGNLTDVSVLVLALEARFCALETAVGDPTAINSAISQTTIQGSTTSLSNSSVSYGSITGWNNSPSTLAQSVQNAWVVIDDLYSAITSIQDNCCPTGCDSVVFGFTTSNIINAQGLVTGINFNFSNSSIPSTFNSSPGFSQVTITDADGATVSATVDVPALQNDPAGYNFSIPTLNTYGNLSILIDFKVTDGVDTCEARQTSVVNGVIPCPSVTITGVTGTGGTVTFANAFGSTAVFTIKIKEVSTGVIAQTYTVNNPSSTVSQAVTGLTANTNYEIIVEVAVGGQTKVCPGVGFSTATLAPPCTDGMDVAFVLDYTFSMSPIINDVKTNIASVINTIDTSSGASNYRIGILTVDEMQGTSAPSYNSCADYTGLPTAQKIANTGVGATQYITAWEMFQTNNGATATTQIQKLNGGVDGTCINIGQGANGPEPIDMAIEQVLSNNFLNAFRANVAKYIVVVTDALPSGDDDQFTSVDYAKIGQLTTIANTQGVKVIVVGTGVNLTFNNFGTLVYPWRELATNTGGSYNSTASAAVINSELVAGCS